MGNNLAQRRLRVSHDADVRCYVDANLRLLNVNLNDLGVTTKLAAETKGPIDSGSGRKFLRFGQPECVRQAPEFPA